jgi:hypothetical protein
VRIFTKTNLTTGGKNEKENNRIKSVGENLPFIFMGGYRPIQ